MNDLIKKYREVITLPLFDQEVSREFLKRLEEGAITREENMQSHFCVYFAVNDHHAKKVFLGQHKKSGLWLFNGGHVHRNELPADALRREMDEELGLVIEKSILDNPFLLTATPILVPPNYSCRFHYDIWYSVDVDMNEFHPHQDRLGEEFFSTEWMTIEQAEGCVNQASTREGLSILQKRFNSSD